MARAKPFISANGMKTPLMKSNPQRSKLLGICTSPGLRTGIEPKINPKVEKVKAPTAASAMKQPKNLHAKVLELSWLAGTRRAQSRRSTAFRMRFRVRR